MDDPSCMLKRLQLVSRLTNSEVHKQIYAGCIRAEVNSDVCSDHPDFCIVNPGEGCSLSAARGRTEAG